MTHHKTHSPPPAAARWDRLSAEDRQDPLFAALLSKNRPTARRLLAKADGLTGTQAARYAALTLHWAPDLLEAILDLGPAEELLLEWFLPDRHHIWAAGDASPRDGWTVRGSLLLPVAMLDDRVSLEILLGRGYRPDGDPLHLKKALAARYFSRPGFRMTGAALPEIVIRPKRGLSYPGADPLCAAILTGSVACAARLLQALGGLLTKPAKKALLTSPLLLQEDACREEMRRALSAHARLPLSAQFSIEDFPFRHPLQDPLFLDCLCRSERLPNYLIGRLAEELLFPNAETDPDILRICLDHLTPLQLSEGLFAAASNSISDQTVDDLCRIAQERQLPLSPTSVPYAFSWSQYLRLLSAFRLIPSPVPGALSGLAALVIREGLQDRSNIRRLLTAPRVLELLRKEPWPLVEACLYTELEGTPNAKGSVELLRTTLFSPDKEVPYDDV